MNFTKKDFYFCLITGLETGFLAWLIGGFLHVQAIRNFPLFGLIGLVPLLWIIGVWLGYFLGRFMGFFKQFGKYSAVGFTNAAVDFVILNFLIASSGVTAGFWYAVFKTLSFTVATGHSYIWNKYWVFGANKTANVGGEAAKFFSVAIGAALINVLVASVIVNAVSPMAGLSPAAWANVGAVAGSASALVASFLGFRLAVFKK